MCGIFGTTRRYERSVVEHKLELMNFRGPDHTGVEEIQTPDGEKLTFGHVRLSIIDLDPRSNQPFVYNDDISIVFNGEVYNYLELKKQYLGDVILRTESDTEVVCAMYEKLGVDSVKLFNGMFAYVIYDRRKNIMVGARDRLGKKPFYFWHEGKAVAAVLRIRAVIAVIAIGFAAVCSRRGDFAAMCSRAVDNFLAVLLPLYFRFCSAFLVENVVLWYREKPPKIYYPFLIGTAGAERWSLFQFVFWRGSAGKAVVL